MPRIARDWDGTPETDKKDQGRQDGHIRCIPLEGEAEPGKCILSGQPAKQRVVFALAY
jgi:prolyl-tRNA synthetase